MAEIDRLSRSPLVLLDGLNSLDPTGLDRRIRDGFDEVVLVVTQIDLHHASSFDDRREGCVRQPISREPDIDRTELSLDECRNLAIEFLGLFPERTMATLGKRNMPGIRDYIF